MKNAINWFEIPAADFGRATKFYATILGVELPKIKVFLNPGKNITVIAEVIAMNHLLRYSGVNPAEAFNERLIGRMREQADVRQYLVEDDE